MDCYFIFFFRKYVDISRAFFRYLVSGSNLLVGLSVKHQIIDKFNILITNQKLLKKLKVCNIKECYV